MSMQRRWFMMTVVVSFLGVGMGALFLFEGVFSLELALGWAVAFVDHGLRSIIDRSGLFRKTFNLFMGGVAVRGLRAIAFVAAILLIVFQLNVEKGPFLFSVFTVYFIFLVYSIVMMYAFPPPGREAPVGSM